MDKTNDIRKGRHCVYDLHAHLVFVTKYRHDVFTGEHLKALERIFSDVCASFDCRLEEFNGETDHVHLLVSFPPTVELSRLVNSLKGVSSRYLRRDYPELAQHYWRGATPLVAQLLRGHGGRCAVGHAETVYREPEPARVIHHRPEGRCTLTQNDGECHWFPLSLSLCGHTQYNRYLGGEITKKQEKTRKQ